MTSEKRVSHRDVLIVEHYDHLSLEARREYRDAAAWADHVDDQSAVLAEFARIDAGRKAWCLS